LWGEYIMQDAVAKVKFNWSVFQIKYDQTSRNIFWILNILSDAILRPSILRIKGAILL